MRAMCTEPLLHQISDYRDPAEPGMRFSAAGKLAFRHLEVLDPGIRRDDGQ